MILKVALIIQVEEHGWLGVSGMEHIKLYF